MLFQIALTLALLATIAHGAVIPNGLDPLRDGRIVGGAPTTISSHPWQVSLQRSGSHFCGGSIISNTVILTAAHCFKNSVSVTNLRVRAGSSYRSSGGTLCEVASLKVHEGYSTTTKVNDVAVLRLKKKLSLGSSMKAIQLATSTPLNGAMASCSGWGTTYFQGYFSYQLQYIDTQIVSRQVCASSRYDYGAKVRETMICASTDSKDACQGDSGGPLVSNGQLVGVVSWGNNCALPNYPGVFANVAELRTWIVAAQRTV